jgi:hypothetical protein
MWPLLAADRLEDKEHLVKVSTPKPDAKFRDDDHAYADRFGKDAIVHAPDGDRPFNTAKDLATIPGKDSPVLATITAMLTKKETDPKGMDRQRLFANAIFEDGYNGTAIAPKPFETTIEGLGKLTATPQIGNGKISLKIEVALEGEYVKEIVDKYAADVPWTQQPKIELVIGGDQINKGTGIENGYIRADLIGLPPVDINKAAEMPKFFESLNAALAASPLNSNDIVKMVQGGLKSMRDAWPAFAISSIIDESSVFDAVVTPRSTDGSNTRVEITAGNKGGEASVRDVLGSMDGNLRLAAQVKISQHDGNADILRIDRLSIGNEGLLKVLAKKGSTEFVASQVAPENGKRQVLDNGTASGLGELLQYVPFLLSAAGIG